MHWSLLSLEGPTYVALERRNMGCRKWRKLLIPGIESYSKFVSFSSKPITMKARALVLAVCLLAGTQIAWASEAAR